MVLCGSLNYVNLIRDCLKTKYEINKSNIYATELRSPSIHGSVKNSRTIHMYVNIQILLILMERMEYNIRDLLYRRKIVINFRDTGGTDSNYFCTCCSSGIQTMDM